MVSATVVLFEPFSFSSTVEFPLHLVRLIDGRHHSSSSSSASALDLPKLKSSFSDLMTRSDKSACDPTSLPIANALHCQLLKSPIEVPKRTDMLFGEA